MSNDHLPNSADDDKTGKKAGNGGSDDKIVDFARVMEEATRLASLTAGEWRLHIEASAERLGVSEEILEKLIDDIITDAEKTAREKAAADRASSLIAARAHKDDVREQKSVARERSKAEGKQAKAEQKEAKRKAKLKAIEFATILRLPVADRDFRLQKLAKLLKEEDVNAIREQFAEYLDNIIGTTSTTMWDVKAWDEPVTAAELLQELTIKIRKHVVMAPHQAVAVALWIMFAWVHDVVAVYSPYLVATSAEPEEGKSTLIMDVGGLLTPRPFPGGEPTPATVFRTADQHKPTLLFDDVDDLFERKPELTSIFKIGYKRGPKIPRIERIGGAMVTQWFDPFCPKACNLIGTNIPKPLHGRCIFIRLKKKLDSEVVTKPLDDDEFATLRSKLKRWSDDNAASLKGVPPSPNFINRESDNWNLQLAIADLAGGDWPVRALEAARLLTRTMHKPSWRQLLLMAFQDAFVNNPKEISSKDFYERITADPLSVWREYNHGTGTITQRQIAHLLKDLDIFPDLIGKGRLSGYRAKDFVDAFKRYLPGRVGVRDPLILSDRKSKAKPKPKKSKHKKRG